MRIRFDEGRHHRAKIGYVLLATEQTIEDDVYTLKPAGVGVHFTRVPIADDIQVETLDAVAESLAPAAGLLLPDGSLDVVTYACTSGSLVVGEQKVFDELKKGAPGARPSSIITAVIRALRKVGARRIVMVTPYVDPINQLEKVCLEGAGFEMLDMRGMGLNKDSDMVRVRPDFIYDYAREIDRDEADAVFISCGALRTLDVVGRLEDDLGKPVVASNQAMIWDALRLAGINDNFRGYGRLLSQY